MVFVGTKKPEEICSREVLIMRLRGCSLWRDDLCRKWAIRSHQITRYNAVSLWSIFQIREPLTRQCFHISFPLISWSFHDAFLIWNGENRFTPIRINNSYLIAQVKHILPTIRTFEIHNKSLGFFTCVHLEVCSYQPRANLLSYPKSFLPFLTLNWRFDFELTIALIR